MNHNDCKYYLATDVFKGICKRTKEHILADESACNEFDRAPKCRYCANYSSKEEYLGECMDKTLAYPDMRAVTCKNFSWN